MSLPGPGQPGHRYRHCQVLSSPSPLVSSSAFSSASSDRPDCVFAYFLKTIVLYITSRLAHSPYSLSSWLGLILKFFILTGYNQPHCQQQVGEACKKNRTIAKVTLSAREIFLLLLVLILPLFLLSFFLHLLFAPLLLFLFPFSHFFLSFSYIKLS